MSFSFIVSQRLSQTPLTELYLATDPLQATVLIKRLNQALCGNDGIVNVWLDAGRKMRGLDVAQIVRTIDVGQDKIGPFYAQEYVDGWNLDTLFEAAVATEKRLPFGFVVAVLVQVLRALDAAHSQRGIVHGNLTPSNVLIQRRGHVKVTDFGQLSTRQLAVAEQAAVMTGRYAYLAPEVCRGESATVQSDLFGAGVLFYEMTCRRRLFRRNSDIASRQAVLSDPIPPPHAIYEDVPLSLETILLRLLSRDVASRPTSAGALAQELQALSQECEWDISEGFVARFAQQLGGDVSISSSARADEPTVLDAQAARAIALPADRSGVSVTRQPAVGPAASLPATGQLWGYLAQRGVRWAIATVLFLFGSGIVGLWFFKSDTDRRTRISAVAIRVESQPPGATVYIDGEKRFSPTPMTVSGLMPGRIHRISVVRPGYKTWTQDFTPLAGSRINLVAKLQPGGDAGEVVHLTINSMPAGAQIYLDGELRGKAPLVLSDVKSGTAHTLMARLSGYVDTEKKLTTLLPGKHESITLTLQAVNRHQPVVLKKPTSTAQ